MSLRAKIASLPIPRIARFTAVVAIAMAAGHLAQTLAAQKPALVVAKASDAPIHIVQLSSGGPTDVLTMSADPELHRRAVEAPTAMDICGMDLSLKSMPAAMIAVNLTASCHREQRVVLQQAGLAVTAKVGLDGKVTLTLPALTAEGKVAVLFADGTRLEQAVAVPEAAGVQRFGVQWQGADAFVLHAMENGADFDQPGDISHSNLGDASLAAGGFLTVLGDATVENPLLAEVYTYPMKAGTAPEIVIEAAVLPETCGHDLLGDVIASRAGQVTVTDLTLAMPDCTGVGDFLVLKNLASDMKIASN